MAKGGEGGACWYGDPDMNAFFVEQVADLIVSALRRPRIASLPRVLRSEFSEAPQRESAAGARRKRAARREPRKHFDRKRKFAVNFIMPKRTGVLTCVTVGTEGQTPAEPAIRVGLRKSYVTISIL